MIHSSVAITSPAVAAPFERPLASGDRIFVRVTQNGRTLLEFTTTSVSTQSEVICETRRRLRGCRGLCTQHIRNMSRGWSIQKPLMIYPDRYRPVARPTTHHTPIFPWDTH